MSSLANRPKGRRCQQFPVARHIGRPLITSIQLAALGCAGLRLMRPEIATSLDAPPARHAENASRTRRHEVPISFLTGSSQDMSSMASLMSHSRPFRLSSMWCGFSLYHSIGRPRLPGLHLMRPEIATSIHAPPTRRAQERVSHSTLRGPDFHLKTGGRAHIESCQRPFRLRPICP